MTPATTRSETTTDLLSHLQTHGYAVVRGALSSEVCDHALADVEAFKLLNADVVNANLDSLNRLYRIVNFHLALTSLRDVFAKNDALALCDAFFEARTALYTTLYFERGSEQTLHRDSPLFSTRPDGRYLGVWASFESTDSENGPLRVVPGSHLLPPLDVRAIAAELFGAGVPVPPESDEAWDAYQALARQQCEDAGLEPIEVHVDKGDIIVWHPSLVHGGTPQLDASRTRKSLVMHVTPEGTPVFHQDVYFDPSKKVPTTPRWSYFKQGDRRIAHFVSVGFGGDVKRPSFMLKQPGVTTSGRLSSAIVEVPRTIRDVYARLKHR